MKASSSSVRGCGRTWAEKAIDIWKLSHGNDGSFAAGEREQLAMERRAVLHKETGASQAKNFQKVADDALFYLLLR